MLDHAQSRQAARVYLTNSRAMRLLPPSALDRDLEWYQQIEGSYQGETYYLDAYVQADRDHLVMVAFNSFGTEIFELQYAEGSVRCSAALSLGSMRPEYILADFQLCFFPAGPVRRALSAAGLSFEERTEGDALVRTVRAGDELIVEIRRTAGEVRYRNLLRGYQYIVRGS